MLSTCVSISKLRRDLIFRNNGLKLKTFKKYESPGWISETAFYTYMEVSMLGSISVLA